MIEHLTANDGIAIQGTLKANGQFPLTTANQIKGGLQHFNTIAERDNMSVLRATVGMLAYVLENDTYYKLSHNGTDYQWVDFCESCGSKTNNTSNEPVPNVVTDGLDEMLLDGSDTFVTDGFVGNAINVIPFKTSSKEWVLHHNFGMNATVDKLLSDNGFDLQIEGFLSSVQYLENKIIVKYALPRSGDMYVKFY